MKKVSLILIVSLMFALLALPVNSQTYKINKVKALVDEQDESVASNLGLYGGKAEDIAIDSTSNNVYATTMAPNGFFISRDLGESWSGLPGDVNLGTGKSVDVDQANGNVYVLIGDDVLKSTDKGASFQEITKNLGPQGGALGQVLLYAQGTLMVALQQGKVGVSLNKGSSFTSRDITGAGSGQTTSLAASPTVSGTFYAVVQVAENNEKLYKSTNSGTSWSQIAMPAGARPSEVAEDPQNPLHIVAVSSYGGSTSYQSFDGGSTWAALTGGGSTHITFDGTGRMYAGQSFSTDNGVSWNMMNTQTPNSSIYADVWAVDPSNVNVMFTNSNLSIAKTVNRGASWTDETNGISSVKTYDISQANNKGVVWIGANGGLAKTNNFTSKSPTWQYPVPGTSGGQVFAVWVKPDNPNIIVFGTANFIKRSVDGGSTWNQVADMSGGGGNVQEIVSLPGNNNILYAAHSNDDLTATDTGAVFKSTDAGATWTNINIPNNAPTSSLDVARDGDVFAGVSSRDAGAPKGVYKYSGNSWTKLSGAFANTSVTSVLADPENANVIMVTVNSDPGNGNDLGGLYKSTNGGISWTKITNGLKEVNNLDSLTVQTSTSPNTFYLAAQDQSRAANSLNGVIYKSTDGGQNWGEFYMGLKQEQFYAMLFDGLTAGNDRGLFDIKSKAAVGLKAKPKAVKRGKITKLIVSLKDAATKKKLKNKTVFLQKIVGKRWKTVKRLKVNKRGESSVNVRVSKTTIFRALWKPSNKADKQEYTTSKSKSLKVKVKK